MSPRPGRISHLIPIDLAERNEDLREEPGFFAAVAAVREALRGHDVALPPRGVNAR
jgi:NitT/TauT family transport system ATP-binding protein